MAYLRVASKFSGFGAITSAMNVGVDDTGHDVKFFGATAGKYMQWDQSEDELVVAGTVMLKEQADADSDTAAFGQIWVNTATPNELYFTNDAGTDFNITDLATSGWPAVHASRSSSIAIVYDTQTTLAMNDEAFDNDNSYDMSTGRFTAKMAGKYYAQFQIQVNTGNTTTNVHLQIIKNGAGQDGAYAPGASSPSSGVVAPNVATIFELAIGDYLDWMATENANASLTSYGDGSLWATFLSCIRIL